MTPPLYFYLLSLISHLTQGYTTPSELVETNSSRVFKKVLCSRDETTVEAVPIGAKDTAIFMAINGVRACLAKFIIQPSCSKIRLTCQPVKQFYINCSEGDRMTVRTEGRMKRYCYHERPNFGGSPQLSGTKPIFSTSDIKVIVKAKSRKSKARCKIRCVRK